MAPSLTRLAPSTLSGGCYKVLKDAILNLDLPPGTLLVEQQIAEQLGISKTPVREALARLEGERLVEVGPNGRQSRVSSLSVKKIREIYQMRILIESAILRETGHNLTEKELADLEGFIEEGAEASELEGLSGYFDANDAFHLYLIQRTGNDTLTAHMVRTFQQIQRVRAALRRAALEDLHHHEFSHAQPQSHRRILDALAQGDAELAAQRMKEDIQGFLDMLESRMVGPALERLNVKPG